MPESQFAHFGQASNVNYVLSASTYLNSKPICVIKCLPRMTANGEANKISLLQPTFTANMFYCEKNVCFDQQTTILAHILFA